MDCPWRGSGADETMTIRISFIIPVLDGAEFPDQSLNAILSQSSEDDEVIVVGVGADGAKADIPGDPAPNVRCIRPERPGRSAALNHAIEATGGEFVWICHSTDILLPGAVDALLAAFDDPEVDFAFGRHCPFDVSDSGEHGMLPFDWPDLSRGSVARHLMEDFFIMQSAALVRRRSYQRVGPFDSSVRQLSDYEMFVRLALAGLPRFVDQEIFVKRKQDGKAGSANSAQAGEISTNIPHQLDERIFRRLHSLVPLSIFEAMFRSRNGRLADRAALLQRACVSARHALWDLAIEDIRAASAILPDTPLDPCEYEICTRMLSGRLDFAEADRTGVIGKLALVYSIGGLQREVVSAILHGMLRHLRICQADREREIDNLIARITGATGSLGSLHNHLSRKFRRPALIEERREPSAFVALNPISCA